MIEELVVFTSTHLAMITLLMPWKKIVVVNTVGTNVTTTTTTNTLMTLFDMNNVAKWGDGISTGDNEMELYNDDLPGTVTMFIGLAAAILFMSIVSFVTRLMYKTVDANVLSVIDFVSWGVTLGLLVMALTEQGDFDVSWKHQWRIGGKGITGDVVDTDKMFLSVGVITVHLIMNSVFVGKDIYERLKN